MKLEAKHRLVASKDAGSHFTIDKEQRYKSRDKFVSMKITDFLAMAKQAPRSAEKTLGVEDLLNKGVKFESAPYLYYDFDREDTNARVTGHEGRHRARALLAAGYTTMPVEIRGPIRWSEQQNPKNEFDYFANWPRYLISEEGDAKIPFPVTRDQAPLDYQI